MYRHPAFEKAINEYFDASDEETRKVLLAVNEEDQNRVLTALTSKLYDNIVDKVDDIDFGEIPLTKGDITKLSNYSQMLETADLIKQLVEEFKQKTENNIDQVIKGISNIASRKDLFMKAYMVNQEMPMVIYNTMTLTVVKSLSYMISCCIDFIKTPDTEAFDIVVDRNAVAKSEHHLLFDNLRKFNESCARGDFDKGMDYVMKLGTKQLLGGPMVVGPAILAVGVLLSIIPIMRELIYFFYYTRVRVSDYFALQADLLQMNQYNIRHARPDLSKEEKESIIRKQTTIINAFRKVSDTIAVDCKKGEKDATTAIVKDSKKFKTSDIMDDVPDSAASSIF
jgi:hypothetical protein